MGIQTIPAYSPQARGRGERNFGTWQGRLPQELRIHGIRSMASANEFLRETYLQEFNQHFAVAAAQPGHAFLPVRGKNLDLIFSLQHERTVNRDNTVHIGPCVLQIEKCRWRATLAGCRVTVYQHLDGTWSIGYGPHIVGHYNPQGIAGLLETQVQPKTLGKRGSLRSPRLPRLNTTNQPLRRKPNRTFHVL
jgi:hypothetical protein